VNRVLVSDDFRLTESFRSTLQNQFTATAENVNFSRPLTIEAINKQVERLTNGKIQNLIPKGTRNNFSSHHRYQQADL
jgi:serine protease inhibitor